MKIEIAYSSNSHRCF